MFPRRFFPSALLGAALSFLAGCSSQTEHPPPVSKEQKLTPERAREALLEMMRSKPGKDLGWFNGAIPDEMGKMKIEEQESGWYAWTGAFRFNPAKPTYTFVVRPQPGVQACVFEYKGAFVSNDGCWTATPPEFLSTALQDGE
jgi:hypothetical protein